MPLARRGFPPIPRWGDAGGTITALIALFIVSYPVWSIALRRDLDLWATDDGPAHLLRTYAIRLGFRESLAFPRWIPDLYRGYGYRSEEHTSELQSH